MSSNHVGCIERIAQSLPFLAGLARAVVIYRNRCLMVKHDSLGIVLRSRSWYRVNNSR